MASKPPPKTYASLDDMIAAGAGAGAGAGLGLGAMTTRSREQEEEPAQETWDTRAQEPVEEDGEDIAARQRSQMIPEPDHEPDPEQEPGVSPAAGYRDADTGAESVQTAVVLFDYEAQEENEIHLTEGQIITEVEIVDEVPTPSLRIVTNVSFRDGGQAVTPPETWASSPRTTSNSKNLLRLQFPPSPPALRMTAHHMKIITPRKRSTRKSRKTMARQRSQSTTMMRRRRTS
jgi:hypothetical protein